MKKNTLVYAMLFILIGLIFLTVIMAVLTGKNGLINQEKEKYNNTHVEEIEEKNGSNVVVIKKK